jgi:hypothetical protein
VHCLKIPKFSPPPVLWPFQQNPGICVKGVNRSTFYAIGKTCIKQNAEPWNKNLPILPNFGYESLNTTIDKLAQASNLHACLKFKDIAGCEIDLHFCTFKVIFTHWVP